MVIDYKNDKLDLNPTIGSFIITWVSLTELQKKNYICFLKSNIVERLTLTITALEKEEDKALASVLKSNVKSAYIVLLDNIKIENAYNIANLSTEVSLIDLHARYQVGGSLKDLKNVGD